MSTKLPPIYEEVKTATDRVIESFVSAFEAWWERMEAKAREKLLAHAVATNGAFSASSAEKVRKQTRDTVIICHLVESVADACDLIGEDAVVIREYRNALYHRKKDSSGGFVFLEARRVDEFLIATHRLVKSFRSKREEAKIADLAAHVRLCLETGLPPAPGYPATVAKSAASAPPPVVADAPKPGVIEEPVYPMPPYKPSARKALDPNVTDFEEALSSDQRAALDAIVAWYRGPREKRFFALAGAAGTGKTTVTGLLIRRLKLDPEKVFLLAPTGKAVEALKARLPRGWKARARTLASFLWKWKFTGYSGEDNAFLNDGAKPVDHKVGLLIVDEASMVTKYDRDALMAYPRVLFTGDPHQLPPVVEDEAATPGLGSGGVLERPDASLERIHRHGVDSSIHLTAKGARSGAHPAYGHTEDGHVVHLSEGENHFGARQLGEILRVADVVLTQRNSTRVMINEYVRRLRGFMSSPVDFTPKAGEILVASENFMHPKTKAKLANGERLIVTSYTGRRHMRTDEDAQDIDEYVIEGYPEGRPHEEGEWVISSQMLMGDQIRGSILKTEHVSGPRSGVLRADWGYALTVHKAQGSEWPYVVIVDDLDPDHRIPLEKWYYVAYSRASERLVILKVKKHTMLFSTPPVPSAGR